MPKFKIPLHRTRVDDRIVKVVRVGGRLRAADSAECCKSYIHACASERASERARCYGTSSCGHRLGQVSDKARSRQVLRELSVCAPISLRRFRARIRSHASDRGLVSPPFVPVIWCHIQYNKIRGKCRCCKLVVSLLRFITRQRENLPPISHLTNKYNIYINIIYIYIYISMHWFFSY